MLVLPFCVSVPSTRLSLALPILCQLKDVAKPPDGLRQLLTSLCADPRNLVFVISGREKEEMQKALGDIKVPCLALPCLALPCLALPCLALPCLVLRCLMLSCLVLCCLILSYLVLCCLIFSCLVLSCLIFSCLVLSCLVLSCPVLSCRVMPCLVMSCLILSYLVLSCLILSCIVLSCLVMSCLILSCLILSCLVLSCLVLSYLVLSCIVLSCLILHCLTGSVSRVLFLSLPCADYLWYYLLCAFLLVVAYRSLIVLECVRFNPPPPWLRLYRHSPLTPTVSFVLSSGMSLSFTLGVVAGGGGIASQNLGLAAEHGLHFRFPGELKMSGNHLSMNMDGSTSPADRCV